MQISLDSPLHPSPLTTLTLATEEASYTVQVLLHPFLAPTGGAPPAPQEARWLKEDLLLVEIPPNLFTVSCTCTASAIA